VVVGDSDDLDSEGNGDGELHGADGHVELLAEEEDEDAAAMLRSAMEGTYEEDGEEDGEEIDPYYSGSEVSWAVAFACCACVGRVLLACLPL
jgi:hypothetical protein